ncbi:hypothetical protein [Streptomyces anulatus]|uniref:hypothetical protein n=1 Tax=Streptomyces anulatus TaxID=1892 RepID=UPI0022519AD5|nr:hypothetical protein [Streptomyces anulatus]MCX4502245.1 hypothetical protein [Streptomyces anulatus]
MFQQVRVARDIEAVGLQHVEGPGHHQPLLLRVGHGRGQPVVVLTAELDGGDKACAVENCVGGDVVSEPFRLRSWRYAELIQTGVDGGQQLCDVAAVPGVRAVRLRVVDHFVGCWLIAAEAGDEPALGIPGWVLAGRFLRRRDDHVAAVGKRGMDEVVAEAVLDGADQAALPKGVGEVPVPAFLLRVAVRRP